MRIVLSGGGTGGHVLPILAVASELKHKNPGIELLFIGSKSGMENEIIEGAKIKAEYIHAGKFRRYKLPLWRKLIDLPTNYSNFKDLFKFVAGTTQAVKILKSFKPDAVFVKGGYVGLPVGIAAKYLKIPFAIHESDSSAGLTNRILAKWAAQVFVSFPHVWGFPKANLIYTGNPIRSDIVARTRDEAVELFGLKRDMPILFFMGGSQGAHRINATLAEVLPELLDKAQVIHATGEKDIHFMKSYKDKLPIEHKFRYLPYAFLAKELPYAYAAADLIISRAGASIFEIAAVGKPSILIPLMHSANNHQVKNAQIFAREGACHVILEEELTGKRLLEEIELLLGNPTKRNDLAEASKKLHDPKAAFRIATHILNLPRHK